MIFLLQFGIIKSRFHYLRRQNLTFWWFLDFRNPGSPYLFILLYKRYFNKYKETYGNILKTYFPYLNFSETHNFGIFRKDGHRKMMKIRVKKSQKSWICIAYLSKTMKWQFGNMYQISFEHIKHFWNQETKTKKPFLFSRKGII